MAYELLVLDLDGTLTNSKKEITAPTREALMDLQKRGKKVVLASGRPTKGIEPLAEELDLATYGSYILSFNGACITDCGTNTVVFNQCVDPKYLTQLHGIAKENGIGLVAFDGGTLVSAFEPNEFVAIEARINKLNIEVSPNFVERIDFPMNKILLPGEPAILEKLEVDLKEKYGKELSIFRSEPYFLELNPQNNDKA